MDHWCTMAVTEFAVPLALVIALVLLAIRLATGNGDVSTVLLLAGVVAWSVIYAIGIWRQWQRAARQRLAARIKGDPQSVEGGPALERAVRALTAASRDRWIAWEAIEALGILGDQAGGSVPSLEQLLADPKALDVTRIKVCLALWRIARHPAVVPHLASLVSEARSLEAVEVLGVIGPDARQAVPVLVKTAQERDEPTRTWIIGALRQIAPREAGRLEARDDANQPRGRL
jgi:hypothetical protein